MNNLSTSLSGIINNFSITGHPYIDTLLLSSFIPIVIGYVTSMSGMFKSITGQLFSVIWRYIKMNIKTRTIGRVALA